VKRSHCIWLIVLLSVSGFLFVKYELIEDYIPKRFGVVERGRIYRSGQLDADLVERTLLKYKIAQIICLTGRSDDDEDIKAEKQTAAKLGIKRLVFALKGSGTGDINNYAGAIAAICRAEKENKPVLLHCAAGAQRTGGVIAAYRLLVQKKDVGFIIAEMRRYGWSPKDGPNLLPYLNSHMKRLAVLLKQKGVIAKIPNPIPEIRP